VAHRSGESLRKGRHQDTNVKTDQNSGKKSTWVYGGRKALWEINGFSTSASSFRLRFA